jgi:Transposase IS116/IS110/IS902 family
MKPFPTHQNLAAWAGMCPGNEDSAGKRRRRAITPGNGWLKRTLVQAAWAASHTKNTYLASQYRHLAGRRGKKRALIAVGHSILVIFYHMLKKGTTYAELGGDLHGYTRSVHPLRPRFSGQLPMQVQVGQQGRNDCHKRTVRGDPLCGNQLIKSPLAGCV